MEGRPSAFIDFDTASPGPRDTDLGYALWMFLDLGPDGADIGTQGRRIRMMCDAYGFDNQGDPISAISRSQQMTLERSQARTRTTGSASSVAYARESVEWIRSEIAGLDAHRDELEAAMG